MIQCKVISQRKCYRLYRHSVDGVGTSFLKPCAEAQKLDQHQKNVIFFPPELLPTFAEAIIHQRGVVAKFFEKDQYGLWIYDFKMWAAFSGGWNAIHLLWALNQTDHCFRMIHDASMQKCNAFYHSAFLSVHILYMTSATVNSNMMRFLHNTQYVSCKFLCQFPPLIMVIYFFILLTFHILT